jgi:hypothetical protein
METRNMPLYRFRRKTGKGLDWDTSRRYSGEETGSKKEGCKTTGFQ